MTVETFIDATYQPHTQFATIVEHVLGVPGGKLAN